MSNLSSAAGANKAIELPTSKPCLVAPSAAGAATLVLYTALQVGPVWEG